MEKIIKQSIVKKEYKHKKIIIAIIIIFSIIVTFLSAFFIYTSIYYKGNDYAKKFMKSDSYVTFYEKDKRLYFESKQESNNVLIFYPGAKISNDAYAPLGYYLAKEKINTVICSFPFNLSLFDPFAAEKVIDDKSGFDYYIGGHSLGGISMSSFANQNSSKIKGLIYLASYSYKDLTNTSLKSLSIYGSKDNIINFNNYKKYYNNFPKLTEKVIIGGNHSYFGSFGLQRNDNEGDISNESQINLTVKEICEWICF